MTDPSLILRKKSEVEFVEIEDGAVLNDGDKVHVLNRTACEVYQLVDGFRTSRDIVREMKLRYPGEEVDAAVQSFIGQMSEIGLISGEGLA